MEARLGADLGAVQVHTGREAATAAERLRARAFTVGRNLYFGAGRFSPESPAGQRLLAHELVHAVQQGAAPRSGEGPVANASRVPTMVQRDEEEGGAAAGPLGIRDVFPYRRGDRIQVNRLLPDALMSVLEKFGGPRAVAFLRAVEGRRAEDAALVTAATEERFEATLDRPIDLPEEEGAPAVRLVSTRLVVTRSGGGFDLEVTGRRADGQQVLVGSASGVQARRDEGGGVVFSSDGEDVLAVRPGEEPGQLRLEAVPPLWIDLVQLSRLPDAPPASNETQRAAERIAARARSTRRTRRQRVTLGGGALHGQRFDPLLSAGWQINFAPVPAAGRLFQIPVEVQLQYAPVSSVLASVSSGVEASLADLNIPVNLRFVTGFGGGSVLGEEPAGGGVRPRFGFVGPTLGGGAGIELGVFRADLRYEHLFNLVADSPNADAVFARIGAAF